MKKTITIFAMLVLASFVANAQDTLAGWTFPTGTSTDANPDFGNVLNSAMTITTEGGTSAIDFTKNGVTTKSAQATGWDSGIDLKCWQIELNTSGYENLKLNSLQTAGGANPGPRDFKVQYRIGTGGTWTDVPGTTIETANDWVTGVVSDVVIPSACNNQASVFIRWIMTSDTSIAPPALVLSTGTAKIDNIFITGTAISTSISLMNEEMISIYPNPAKNFIMLNAVSNSEYEIISFDGRIVKAGSMDGNIINISDVSAGMYFFEFKMGKNIVVKKLLIQ